MQCPNCTSQDMLYKEGEKNGKKWRGWFCQEKPNGQKCGGVSWVKATPQEFGGAKAAGLASKGQAPSKIDALLAEIRLDVKKILSIVGNGSEEETPF